MHGLITRALQSFVCLTYGRDRWVQVTEAAGLGFTDFEAMLVYDSDQFTVVMDRLCDQLARSPDEVLEDFGTFLVSHPRVEALRRLLRFGGETYVEFLHSLDDLPDRARMAVDDLHLPRLELREHATGGFSLTCGAGLPGFGAVMMGVLRAMADDYGALALLEREKRQAGKEVIAITLVEADFARGRDFELGARAG